MPDYRVITITADGRASNARHFVCDSDEDAVVWAEQQLDTQSIELWSEERVVKRLHPKKPNGPVTHKIQAGELIPQKASK